MLTLAIDTATPQGRFAVAEGAVLLAYQPYNVSGSYADALLPVIDTVLAAAGRRLDEVARIGVTDGPGSFTGVRIGVATAKALAWALDAELHAVSTLAAMATALLGADPGRDLAVPVLDARRGEIFAAVYRRRGGWVDDLAAPACLPPALWWERLRRTVADLDAPAYGGDGVTLLVGQGASLRPELAARGMPTMRDWTSAHPATAPALALALADPELCAATRASPFALVPRYLRGSDAELLRHVDATPGEPSSQFDIHPGLAEREDPS